MGRAKLAPITANNIVLTDRIATTVASLIGYAKATTRSVDHSLF